MLGLEDIGQAAKIRAGNPDNIILDPGSNEDQNEDRVSEVERDEAGSFAGEVVTKRIVIETETGVQSTFDNNAVLVDMEKVENGVSCFAGANSVAKMVDVFWGDENNKNNIADVSGSLVNVDIVDEKKQVNDGEISEHHPNSSFHVGDFVWGKIKSHPWWPGQIYDSKDASDFAAKHSQEGRLLVAFFGDGSCSWCLPSQLVPFVENFKRLSSDSSTKSFQNAINCAINDVARLIEHSVTCQCLLPQDKENGFACSVVSNAGVRKGVSVPHVDISQICVPEYDPTEILEKLTRYAKYNYTDSLLELAVMKSYLSAFYNARDGHKLPAYSEPTYIEGLEEKNKSAKELSAEDFSVPVEIPIQGPREDDCMSSPALKSLASPDDKIHHRRKQKSVAELMGENDGIGPKSKKRAKVREENDAGNFELALGKIDKRRNVENVAHGDISKDDLKKGPLFGKPNEIEVRVGENISGDELEMISSPRERKKSKYLSPPYTDLRFRFANFSSKVKLESDKSKKRDHSAYAPTSKSVDEAADNKDLNASSRTVKSDKKIAFKASQVELQVGELLSEIHSAAVDPLYLSKKGSLDSVCTFVSAIRKSTYLQRSYYEILQKSKSRGKKRKLLEDQENGIGPLKSKSAGDGKTTPKSVKKSEQRKLEKHKFTKSSDFFHAKNCIENFGGSPSTSLILTFAPTFPLPSKDEILGLFRKFGSLNEKETDVFTESHTVRIVYSKNSEAEMAFISSVRECPFGFNNVNYLLHHSAAGSKPGPLVSPRAFDEPGSSQQVEDFMVDVRAMRQKLEIVTAILENYHSKFSSEEKSGLKDDMKQLMENVEAVSDKVRVMAGNTPSC